jgi:hypothetical protein
MNKLKLLWLFLPGTLLIFPAMILRFFLTPPEHAEAHSCINLINPKPTLVFWLSETCPLSRKYVPELHRIFDSAQAWKWNTMVVSVQDGERDPLFQALQPDAFCNDTYGHLARWFNTTVVPSVTLYNSLPQLHAPADGVLYQGAIDNWSWETGQLRTQISQRFLWDAMKFHLEGAVVRPACTKPVGCFIEFNQ